MSFMRRVLILTLIAGLSLAVVVLPAGTTAAATWTKIATNGLTPPDPTNTFVVPGSVFQNRLVTGGVLSLNPAPMHYYNGSAFTKVGSSGFGTGSNVALYPYVEYKNALYIGTQNPPGGCELWKWTGSGNPTKVRDGGFGEGGNNYWAIPLGVVNDRLIIGVQNVVAPNAGLRIYSYNGSTWTTLVGPGAPVAPGFGDPNNDTTFTNQTLMLNGKLYILAGNNNTGLEVYSYDGAVFTRVGQPGAGSWPANLNFAWGSVSQAEGRLYVGAGDIIGAATAQLWSYDGTAWSKLGTDGFGNANNSSMYPLSRGDDLYVATANNGNGCRVYKRTGANTFAGISAYAFGDPGLPISTYLASFNGRLLAFTDGTGGNGADVYATSIGPSIDRLSPNSGPYGTTVRIEGHDFGKTRGTGAVTFKGWNAEVLSWSDTVIEALFPYQSTTGPVVVHTSRGDSNAVTFSLTLSKTWYFAEGSTRDNAIDGRYEEWLCVQNPGTTDANLEITYMRTDGTTKKQTAKVAKQGRSTISVNAAMGPDQDVSTFIQSDQLVLAERPMYFNYRGKWTGGHDVIGLPAPRTNFFFAEGTTRANAVDGYFEEWLCFQNPGDDDATVSVDYILGPDGAVVNKAYGVKAKSRRTVDVNLEIGPDRDVSAVVTSDRPIVAERPLYFNYHNKWTGGHDVIGAPGPDRTFYFAEGTTRDNAVDGAFEEWICLQNAGSQDANVTITYYTDQAGTQTQNVVVDANSRQTVDVKLKLGVDVDTSFKISSDRDILAERPMYFNYHSMWDGGHDVMGCAQPKKQFYFAEGTTLPDFATWIAVMNPGSKDTVVTFHYMLGNGTNKQVKATVEANKRYTRDVAADVGLNQDVSILVEAGRDIVVERPMYFGYHYWCSGGHDTLGYGI